MEERKLSELKSNPQNPRGLVVEDDALSELADSIRSHGVLQPILITPDNVVVAGHRRVVASGMAGRITIPVVVRAMSELEQVQIMLIENIQRENLSALQIAKTYTSLLKFGLSVRQIAKATGFGAASISSYLTILDLSDELHALFDAGALPLGCVHVLLELPADEQIAIGLRAAEQGWTVKRISSAVKGTQSGIKQGPPPGFRYKKLTSEVGLGGILEQLETIDEYLLDFPELKQAQTLLRQASRIVINAMEKAA